MSQAEELTKSPPLPASSTSPRALFPVSEYDGVLRRFHHHNLSDSTNTTGSNDSSPTTTISTVDDSSATEPSPGSSPESPPLSTFAVGMLRPRTADDSRGAFFELQKQPPPRKGRNLKNLAVNTTRNPDRAASTTSLPLSVSSEASSTLLSPSFVKPPTPPRRKPSNLGLTILTPAPAKLVPQEVRLTVPPTPGFGRPNTLRQYQSSPSLPLIPGLGLPHNNQITQQQRTLDTIFSPIDLKDPIPADDEEEQNFDIPLSREEKPEAYPDGPICVYEPGIDLYLEPTAEQCRQYDVVMNVASEVLNPMIEHPDSAPAQPDLRIDGGGGIQFAPKRSNLVRAHETESSAGDASPSTPKATSLEDHFPKNDLPSISEKEPEYIHIKWEHNSDIVPDLLGLVKLIDEKVTAGKRILIHCQCGVSRSASLVVAYGLYKDPSLSVQEAYDAVKKRSKWIGPNMNLIMQLQEFRSSLARGGILSGNRGLSPIEPSSALSEWKGPFSSMASPQSIREMPLSAAIAPATATQTADSLAALSPGPSSAPSGVAWPSNDKRPSLAVKPTTAYVDPSGHVIPVLNIVDTEPKPVERSSLPKTLPLRTKLPTLEPAISSPRSAEFAMTPVKPAGDADPADSFGILSPTSTEFASNPFDRSALLASLGMGSIRPEQEAPRRSLSLRKQNQQQANKQPDSHLGPTAGRPLRGKISSPSLREQQQLQSLQAKIEASLPTRISPSAQPNIDDGPLMSPRATEFTQNPFALALPIPSITTTIPSPENGDASRSVDEDPRSPAHKGASPITRNIYTFL